MKITRKPNSDTGADDIFIDDAYQFSLSYVPIPIVPNIHMKMLAAIEARPNSFNMDSWHGNYDGHGVNTGCGTTHCYAGWAVHLAGEAGYNLEKAIGSEYAGQLILTASCPHMTERPFFFGENVEALAEIRRLAAEEKLHVDKG